MCNSPPRRAARDEHARQMRLDAAATADSDKSAAMATRNGGKHGKCERRHAWCAPRVAIRVAFRDTKLSLQFPAVGTDNYDNILISFQVLFV